MKNRRKIAAQRVFTVFGNYDVQTGWQTIRKSACGSECRRFESVRAPKRRHRRKAMSFFCEKCETKIGIAVSNVFFHFSIKIFVSLKKKDYICPQISIFKLNFNVQISNYTSRPHDGCYGSSRRKADGNY